MRGALDMWFCQVILYFITSNIMFAHLTQFMDCFVGLRVYRRRNMTLSINSLNCFLVSGFRRNDEVEKSRLVVARLREAGEYIVNGLGKFGVRNYLSLNRISRRFFNCFITVRVFLCELLNVLPVFSKASKRCILISLSL